MVSWLVDLSAQGTLDLALPEEALFTRARDLLVAYRRIPPPESRLLRALGSARRAIHRKDSDARVLALQKALGVVLEDLPLARRWRAARELLRFPPATAGKANVPKMVEEHRIFHELSAALAENHLDVTVILHRPECEDRFVFVERHRPSLLAKWEKRTVLEALPFYLARRLQEALDAILLCFTRKARLVRERTQSEAEEGRRDETLALLERTGPQLRTLKVALARALSQGTPAPLRRMLGTLSRFETDRELALDRWRLYRIIASRGMHTRKLARRLTGIGFVAHDPHAERLLRALPEVLRFASFKERVARTVVENLSFLQVPGHLLEERQVFEPVVLTTLAEHLSSGRMTARLSRRFGDVVEEISGQGAEVNPRAWLAERQRTFEQAWQEFERAARQRPLVQQGRLLLRRPGKVLTPLEERLRRERHDRLVARLGKVSILQVVLRVHRRTGFLDELRLRRRAPHQLPERERLHLAAGILVAMAMNVAVGEMTAVLGRGYRVGRVQHFIDHYLTKENLERALQRLQASWDERHLGRDWGPGHLIAVDGKVVGAFENNLLSRYHYRRGRSGMTVYWFRRDDGIATRVKPLGNQEWESWHVIDELLRPLVGELRESCGDTQAQFLGLWGLAELTDRRILVRFRKPARVLLYKPTGRGRAGLEGLRVVNWALVRRALPCLMEVAEAVRSGRLQGVEVLRRWHLYDRHGHDLGEALRELGKIARTGFLLRYAGDEKLQRRIQKACNEAENWNSFHEFFFWGNGGKLRTNDIRRQEETLLALNLVMDAVVYDNVATYGQELKAARSPTPVIWEHITVLGRLPFRQAWFHGSARGGFE